MKPIRAEQPLLTSTQIFKKPEIEGIKTIKRCRILCELGSVKISPIQPPLTKANILVPNLDQKIHEN